MGGPSTTMCLNFSQRKEYSSADETPLRVAVGPATRHQIADVRGPTNRHSRADVEAHIGRGRGCRSSDTPSLPGTHLSRQLAVAALLGRQPLVRSLVAQQVLRKTVIWTMH